MLKVKKRISHIIQDYGKIFRNIEEVKKQF
jgi:hypothetical protein